MSEKYAFWITFRLLKSMRGGKSELQTLQYMARISQARFINSPVLVSSSCVQWHNQSYSIKVILNRREIEKAIYEEAKMST